MKPLLTNSVPALTDTMPKFCLPVTRILTTKEQEGIVRIKTIFLLLFFFVFDYIISIEKSQK
jgi:hypothetical protein